MRLGLALDYSLYLPTDRFAQLVDDYRGIAMTLLDVKLASRDHLHSQKIHNRRRSLQPLLFDALHPIAAYLRQTRNGQSCRMEVPRIAEALAGTGVAPYP